MPNTALNRTTVALLTNKSGGALAYGDVVILDNTNAKGFTTTTTAGLSTRGLGVIIEPNGIANNASGMVATAGWCPKVNLNAAATVGQFIKTHTVAGQGTPHSSPQVEGDFGVALQASATPEAILFGSVNPPVATSSAILVESGADSKISAMTVDTSPTVDDLLATVHDPAGTPANRRVSIDNLWKILPLSAAVVTTDEIRNSASYGDLTTAGPSVTLTHVGTIAIIWMSCTFYKVANAATSYMSVDVSGSNTIAANDTNAVGTYMHTANAYISLSRVLVLTGLTPGTTTFKLQYKADTNNNAHFLNRTIAVFAP